MFISHRRCFPPASLNADSRGRQSSSALGFIDTQGWLRSLFIGWWDSWATPPYDSSLLLLVVLDVRRQCVKPEKMKIGFTGKLSGVKEAG